MRWIGSLVAEAYRILIRGGVFLYPADARARLWRRPPAPGLRGAPDRLADRAGRRLGHRPGASASSTIGRRACTSACRWSSARATRSSASPNCTAIRCWSPSAPRRCSRGAACSGCERGDPCPGSIRSSPSPAPPAPARPRSRGPSSRSSAARRSTPSTSRATPSIATTAPRCARSMAQEAEARQQALQPFQPGDQPARGARACLPRLWRDRHRDDAALRPRRRGGRAVRCGARHLHRLGAARRRTPTCCSTRACTAPSSPTRSTSRATPT